MAVTDDVKLDVYNHALRILGSRRLASLTEARKPRRLLDDAWGSGDKGVLTCLEHADWNFASRVSKLEYDPAMETSFGWEYTYQKPDDVRRLSILSASEYLRPPLTAEQYSDQEGYWLCNYVELYVRYVSDGTDYGLDSGKWSEAFKDYVAAYLAVEIVEPLTNSDRLFRKAIYTKEKALSQAKTRDAQDEGVKFPPQGSWSRSRGGRGSGDNHRIFFS